MRQPFASLAACSLLTLGACSRDLSLPSPPPPPGPGAVYGRVVVAVPGSGVHQPAPGSTVALLGGSLATTANELGNFRLDGLDQAEGSLLFRYEHDGGVQQRLLDLALLGTGPGREVALGDVAVVDNASLHGKALRSDVADPNSGHAGTIIFVPQGPFTAYTGDDGSYTMDNLPEGRIQVGIFHAGYAAVTRADIELRSGEDFPMQTVMLVPETGAAPGSISGTVRFVPALASATGTTVSATVIGGQPSAGSVGADGHFTIAGLSPGVYDVGLAHDGYATAVVSNVLVNAGADSPMADVVLAAGTTFDAGTRPPPPDAGTDDGGSADGGAGDAGAGDAGATDAGSQLCGSTADCPAPAWCDPVAGACRAPCTAVGSCSNGRVCEPSTGTCAVPCGTACPLGTSCQTATQVCRAACDVSTPCSAGLRCTAQGQCVPECSVTADCTAAHRVCQAGQCVSDHTCTTDLDCPSSQLCTAGVCTVRQGPAADGGLDGGLSGFLCANACSCRADEACEDGVCVPEKVPTRYLAADGGGSGLTPADPSSDLAGLTAQANASGGGWLALRGGDRFDLSATLALDGGVALAGGYVSCGAARWVRSSASRTTVTTSNGVVLQIGASAQNPAPGVTVKNLAVFDSVGLACSSLIEAAYAPNLTLAHVSGAMPMSHPGCGGAGLMGLFNGSHLDQLSVDDLGLSAVVPTGSSSPVGIVALQSSSGRLSRLYETGVNIDANFTAVSVNGLSGPLSIVNASLPTMQVGATVVGVAVSACGAFPLTISGVQWAVPAGGAAAIGVSVTNCPLATITGNTLDGAGVIRVNGYAMDGIDLTNSGGVVNDNVVSLPSIGISYSAFTGIKVLGPLAPTSVSGNTVSGGLSNLQYGLFIESLDSGGPLLVSKNTIALGQASTSQGIHLLSVGSGAGLRVLDNSSRAAVYQTACSSLSYGLWMSGSSGIFERNRFFADGSGYPFGAVVYGAGQVELYQNHFYAGRTYSAGGCGGPATGLAVYDGASAVSVFATGNTIEGNGDVGISSMGLDCSDAPLLFMTSNAVSGGQAPSAWALHTTATGACFKPARWSHNYLSLASALQPVVTADQTSLVALVADAGVPDSSGNIRGAGSCFDPGAPFPRYKLATGSPCIDRGLAGQRVDTSTITLDLDNQPRQLGPAVDIGCSEKQ